jgi:hypothetical protein
VLAKPPRGSLPEIQCFLSRLSLTFLALATRV